ncbi:hypothetical protein BU24DRAFT_269809 [Aaosphaeria arxii CBS 175.79]|uniref:Zn(2)-C6 fungal-type domain-containing protein n=1 Tax=Aaosphaeria arxii CBS 175.79 TaxID=1450172 RepID=A0A6A5XIF5_9PLEO|nr:uncharacterized protein BU24DRAFT_269809 [Aaosphaeria arxii CBS 175.79]KAF2012094.1 hypothetical protein BU24DRAFT_269809 [Aaosphaeria arxii CBS 175.79]
MVYTGKPSRGCQMCKSRRIKCDEKRPTCGQCQKSGRTCPGYPDEFDLVFRDENKAMERKARKASGSSTAKTNTDSQQTSPINLSPSSTFEISPGTSPFRFIEASPSESTDFQLITMPSHIMPPDAASFDAFMWSLEHDVPPVISLPPDFEAVPFFFKNFVSLPQQADTMRGYLELLVPLYNKARPSSALHLATNAVALAACCNYPGKEELRKEAISTYGKALRKLNSDLKDPVASKSDESILATLLFSLYETIMSTDDTITAWGNHVDGAVALTKMRGPEQLKDPMSHDVFRAVRTMMITSCVQRSKPIETFPGETGWVTNDINDENAANRLTLICMDLPNIRARANALTGTLYDAAQELEARDILEYAQMVDTNLQQWYDTIPTEWQYRTAGMEYNNPDDVSEMEAWPGPIHVYHDVSLASIVNDYRVCRIFCQRVVMACVTWLSFGGNYLSATQAYNSATFIIQKMVDEISACVKFHMSYDMQPVAQELQLEPNAAEAFGGYSLVWPLYVAANAETVPQRQRDWLSGRLYTIGTKFGLNAAQVLVLARRHVLTCGPMFP